MKNNQIKECRNYYNFMNGMFEFEFKENRLNLFMEDDLAIQVKSWLNNDEKLLKQAFHQVKI